MKMSKISSLRLGATGIAVLVAGLAGCGGGVTDDSGGTAERLTCLETCTPSNTVNPDQLSAHYALVSEGGKVQAQAGFNTGDDPRFNVEVAGGDKLRVVTASGANTFHIPSSGGIAGIIAAFPSLLIIGATPYLSDVPSSATTLPADFEFVRGATVYKSSVTLPAPFSITAPAAGATFPMSTRTLSVRLASGGMAPENQAEFKCADSNGNTANSTESIPVATIAALADGSGYAYTLDLGAVIDTLIFTTTFPRGAVASCDIGLSVTLQNDGTRDARLGSNTRVFAQQIRRVSFALR